MNILYTETFKTEAGKLLTQFFLNAEILLPLIFQPPSPMQIILVGWCYQLLITIKLAWRFSLSMFHNREAG